MPEGFTERWDAELRSFAEALLAVDTSGGNERPAQAVVRDRLASLGFETVEWSADADALAVHPSFPDDPDRIDAADRPSVAGVLELGDPDAGPTLVLNGHVDVVPVTRASWSTDPFEPTWDGDRLRARGAADMKAGLAACVFAARHAADAGALDGRLVVESVAGEEEGGLGAAAAALSSPYPFECDAAVVAEPTDLRAVTATEGCLMTRLELVGRSAHAATRWRGESVLPRFEAVRAAFRDLERERAERVTHPLYGGYPVPWPVTFGTVDAGTWASSVPAALAAEVRIGVAPGETVAEVESAYRERLRSVAADDEWLSANPPSFERFSVQFEPSTVDPDERVVRTLQSAMRAAGLTEVAPEGATYGADSRHYNAAGVPTALFGPGSIERAHFPDESVAWDDVLTAGEVLAATARSFLG